MAMAHSESAVKRVDAKLLADAVRVAEEIDAMRSALASTIDPKEMEVDEETFKLVCKPVGMRAKKIAGEKGWEFRQLAIKYRNPKNKADPQALKAMKKFARESELQGFWMIDSRSGKDGFRYFKRITVEPACLACHGEKEKRPDFIKTKYPDDSAFGFASGDLRGVYSINFQSRN
jgi:hypothetical protein